MASTNPERPGAPARERGETPQRARGARPAADRPDVVPSQAPAQMQEQAEADEPAARHPASREERIRLAAYQRFLRRAEDGEPGDETSDWLQAEADITHEDLARDDDAGSRPGA
jgi:hypothetical protein